MLGRRRRLQVCVWALLWGSGCLVWTGNRSPNWNDSRNWYDTNTGTTSTHPPGPLDDVVFTGNYVRNCNITGAASARSVTVQSGYTGRINLLGSLSTGSVDLQGGTLRMPEGTRLVLGGGRSLVVGAGGTLEATGTASQPVTIAARDGEFFSAELAGNVSIARAVVRNVAAEGVTLSGGSGRTASLSNTAFENLQTPSAFYLRITGAAWSHAILNGLSFQDVGPGPHTTNTVYLDIPGVSTYVQLVNYASQSPPYTAGEGTSAEAADDYVVWGPLAVSLGRCAAWRTERGAELAWETVTERANAGFHVERAPSMSGPWERLTARPVPGAGGSRRARVYRWLDRSAPRDGDCIYRILDVDLAGRETPHAPFGTDDAPPEWLEQRRLAASASRKALASGAGAPPGRPSPASPQGSGRWRLVTEGEGVFALGEAELAAMGVEPGGELALASGGRPIGFARAGGGIVFHAAPWRTRHARMNVTFLEPGATASPGPPPTVDETRPLASRPRWRARIEENLYYYPYYASFSCPRGEEPWYSDELAEPGRSWTRTADLGEVADGPATLGLRLVGFSADPALDPDHRVRVLVNGVALGEAVWDGFAAFEGEMPIPAGVLGSGENQVALEPLELGASWNWVLVDWIEFDYEAPLRARGDFFALDVPPGAAGTVAVGGFSSGEVYAFRVESGATWSVLCECAPEAEGRFRAAVRVSGGPGGARFVLAGALALRSVARIEEAPDSGLRSPRGVYSYAIVAPREFRAAAQALAAYRSTHGQTVLVADYEATCDEFSSGRAGPEAVRELVGWHRPRYLLLLGDATFDPLDFSLSGERDFVPAFFTTDRTSEVLSDEPFSRAWGEPLPDIAVGRIPARSASEASALVAKVIAGESAARSSDPVVLVADDDRPAYAAACDAALAELGEPAEKIYIGQGFDGPGARAALHTMAAAGARTIFYMGHGGSDRWAAENLLSVGDAPGFAPGRAAPVVALSCLNAAFDGSGGESLGEALLRADGAGAWAFVGSVGFSDEGAQAVFGENLARELARGARLGDAAMLAKRALPVGATDVRRTFHLLGDPASGGSEVPSVRVISPNGGEQLPPGGEAFALWAWTGDPGTGVTVELSTDGGANWQVLAEDAPNTGSLSWHAPELESADCLLRVRSLGTGAEDVSDERFAIAEAAASSPPAGGCAGAGGPSGGTTAVALAVFALMAFGHRASRRLVRAVP